MLEEFSEKQDDITLDGDESVKQEYLEETSEETIKQEDQQEDGITVESIDDADDNDGVEHELEIGGIESDYNGSVASDNDEPETAAGPSNEPVNENHQKYNRQTQRGSSIEEGIDDEWDRLNSTKNGIL